jgi:hypothetical protein
MGLLRFMYSEKEIKEMAMSDIEKWRRYPGPNSAAGFFGAGIAAIRLGLLNEEETKKVKNEIRLWLAHEDTLKRPKPRSTIMQIWKKIKEHGEEWSVAQSKDIARLHAREDFDSINEIRDWLAEQDAINNEQPNDEKECNDGKHSSAGQVSA